MPFSPKPRCYRCNKREKLKSGLCFTCRQKFYGREYRQMKAAVLLPHIARFGPWCPGFKRQSHKVLVKDLTVDHRIPVARGGETVMSNLHVLCGSCNSAKAAHGQVAVVR